MMKPFLFICLSFCVASLASANTLKLSPYLSVAFEGRQTIEVPVSKLGSLKLVGGKKERLQLPAIRIGHQDLRRGRLEKQKIVSQLVRWTKSGSARPAIKVNGPDYVRLVALGERVSGEVLSNRAMRALKSELAKRGFTDVKVSPSSVVKDVVLTRANSDLSVLVREFDFQKPRKRMSVWLDIVSKGTLGNKEAVEKSIPVWFEVEAITDVWGASEDIQKGTDLSIVSFARKQVDIAKMAYSPISDIRDFEGKINLRKVSAGQVMTRDMLGEAPYVRTGELVAAEVRVGKVYLQSKMEAMENGYIGQKIRLKSLSSGDTLMGTLMANGRVSVGG